MGCQMHALMGQMPYHRLAPLFHSTYIASVMGWAVPQTSISAVG